jgi:hypothetical protein
MSFIARYDGECGFEDCPTHFIHPGSEVEYADDVLMHASCAARARRSAQAPLCNVCTLHHYGAC